MSTPLSRWLIYTLPFSIILWSAGPGGFESTKLAWLSICLVVATWLSWRQGLSWRESKLSWLIIVWMLYLGILATGAAGPATAWLGTQTNPLGVVGWWLMGGLTLIVINHDWTEADLKTLRRSLVWTAWLLITSVIVQRWNGFGINWTTFDDPTRGRELFGSIGSPAQLGVVTALLFSLLIQFRQIGLTAIGLTVLTIASQSTTGIGLLAITIAIAVTPAKIRSLTKWIIGTALTIVCLVITTGLVQPNRWPSLADRAAIWQSGLASISGHSVFGWGPNHFSLAYDTHYPANQADSRALTEERAHNMPLEVLVETGLVGLILAVTILYPLGRRRSLTGFVWLIAALFNPIITPIATLGIISLIAQPTKKEPAINRYALATAGILSLLIAYICIGLWQNTIAADAANKYSSEYEFAAAANAAQRLSAHWPQHPQIALIIAEAQTNTAIKTNSWVETDAVVSHLDYSRRQSVGFLPDRIRYRLAHSWLQAGVKDETLIKIENDWQGWSAHPRFDD